MPQIMEVVVAVPEQMDHLVLLYLVVPDTKV
jgi:hypothetical protein